jgi:antitoxin component of MazEF toxin-antitoxin module
MYYMELKTRIRRMGNSLGVIIPADTVRSRGFREGENVSVIIEGEGWTVGEIMKEARRQKIGDKFKKSTQKILDEIDRELEPEMFEE